MKALRDKKGSISMSFGMIFSIILIAFFLTAGFLVIKHFLGLQKCSQVGLFINDLQDSTDRVWKSSSKTETLKVILPGSINKVCFVNFTLPITNGDYDSIKRRYSFYNPNMFFDPPGKACDIPYYSVKHINITKIIEMKNPYCITVDEGTELTISKDFYESLVTIQEK